MPSIAELWLPILLSAVFVWMLSALVWTVLPHHKKDFAPVADEQALRETLNQQRLAPGQYVIPHLSDFADMKTDAGKQKYVDGPVGFITVLPNGMPVMGGKLVATFMFFLLMGTVIAYLASRTMGYGTDYLQVFRVTGAMAFIAHGFGVITDGIWFGRPWANIAKHLGDALMYGLLTGGVFGWLWPAVT